jgi:hypothetical protein
MASSLGTDLGVLSNNREGRVAAEVVVASLLRPSASSYSCLVCSVGSTAKRSAVTKVHMSVSLQKKVHMCTAHFVRLSIWFVSSAERMSVFFSETWENGKNDKNNPFRQL